MPDCEIVLHGTLDPRSIPALVGFSRHTADGATVLRGALASEEDVAAILDAFASLGLGLHSLKILPAAESARATGQPSGTP